MNMAKRKYSKMTKIEPSVQTFSFIITSGDAGKETNYIDLSQCASLLNRRFYRQGINWAVSSFKILSGSGVTGQVSIQKLPNTWVMGNAWEKGFRHWMKMNNESLESSESIKPKFLDFKIYANDDHHVAGIGNNLLPHSGATLGGPIQVATKGEWVHSTFHIPNASVDSSDPTSNNPRSVIAVGANYQSVGADGQYAVSLIEGYAASRGLPDIKDPNVPADADSVNASTAQNWLAALDNDFDQQTGEVLADMISENNLAPYPFENDGANTDTMYPGGANQLSSLEIHDQEFITTTTVGGTTRLKGGNFPCGLIEVATFGVARDETLVLQVNLVPGNHRGYLCEPMTEM
jgi:hypothetical protein